MKHTETFNLGKINPFQGDFVSKPDRPPKTVGLWLTILKQYVLLLLLIYASVPSAGQSPMTGSGSAPITGSGASAILGTFDFNGQTPDLTDPCTCAGQVADGTEIFNDEIIIQSYNRMDQWELDVSASSGVFQPNSNNLFTEDTLFTLVAAVENTNMDIDADSVFIFTLPIAHAAGVGYEAIIAARDEETIERYDIINDNGLLEPDEFMNMIANTCSKVGVGFDLMFDNVECMNGANITGIALPSTQTIVLDVFNQQDPIPTANLLASGTVPNVGESASIYVGSATNPRKILIERFQSGESIGGSNVLNLDFNPSDSLAIGGFNPLTDTLLTFVYDADTSRQAGAFDGGDGLFDNTDIQTAIGTDPGCEADTSASINWNMCSAGSSDYSVGGIEEKYDSLQRTFIVCPCDPNKQLMKIAFGRLIIAVGDTLTIYEGAGTNGAIRERLTTGAVSATTELSSTWFQANCDSDNGCLTVVFSPDANNSNNGTGFNFIPTCEPRPATVTCPSATTIAGACGVNQSNSVAALHTIVAPTSNCSFDPLLLPVGVDTNGINITLTPEDDASNVNANGEYHDANGNDTLDVGETVFLQMEEYTITYRYEDVNCDTLTCDYGLTVSEITPVCNNQINVSLSAASCNVQLTPDMLIEGEGCAVGYTLNILDGPDAGTSIVTDSSLGRTIRVEAVTPFGNRCWGLVLVEDKAGPRFTCRDTSIFCGISTDPSVSNLFPTDGDDCSLPVTYQFSDSEQLPFGCTRQGSDFDTTGMIVRTWTAFDANNMASTPCVQNIYLLKPNLSNASNIIWPEDTIFYCQNASTDPDFTLPASTGFPSFRIGNDTIPLTQTCYFGLDFADIDFDTDCEGTRKIQRTWTILDWCGGANGSNVIQDPGPQIIQVLDTVGPTISNFPDTLAFFSPHGSCIANVVLPAITVTDQCSPTNTSFRIIGPSSTIFNQADTMENVPFGTHTFTYIAEDGCGNQTRDSLSLTIKDNVAPTAIAGEVAVTLTSATELTWVYATSFDAGSHDNCGIDSILARIMGDTVFSEQVGFNCSNLGTVMVELRVVDECGNATIAMSEVTVADKNGLCGCNIVSSIQPTDTSGTTNNDGIICQGDQVTLTVSAQNNPAGDTLADDAGLGTGYSLLWSDGITTNPRGIDVAGRYFVTITSPSGCTGVDSIDITVDTIPSIAISADQTICAGDSAQLTVTGGINFIWTPTTGLDNATIANPMASPSDTTSYIAVIQDGNGCMNRDTTAVSVITPTVDAGPNDTICNGELTELDARSSSLGTFLWSPSNFLDDPTVANPEVILLPTTTTFTVTFTDTTNTFNCTATDSVTVIVNDLPTASISIVETSGTTNNDGVICQGDQAMLIATGGASFLWSTGANTNFISVANAGDYAVTVTDTNGCEDIETVTITVNTLPNITPLNDTTICPGDTISLITTVTANSATNITWSPDSSLSNAFMQSPMAFPDTTTKYFVTAIDANNCVDLDSVNIAVNPQTETLITVPDRFTADVIVTMQLQVIGGGTTLNSVTWIPDTYLSSSTGASVMINSNGAIDTIAYVANFEDNNGCTGTDTAEVIIIGPMTSSMAALSGSIITESGERVEQTTVSLDGYEMNPAVTGATGEYEFTEVPTHESYTVKPEKNTNPLNGISTFDLVLMSKHILGIDLLDSPYKMIAADINRSGTITAFDLVQLRRLILNVDDTFPNNTSWRFVDATYAFENPANPLVEAFPETYQIDDLDANMTWLDFIAIKIGDVNNTANVHNFQNGDAISRKRTNTLYFETRQSLSDDGETLVVEFNATNFQSILGYQFTMEFDPTLLAFDKVIPTDRVGEESFGLREAERGILTSSWNESTPVNIRRDETIFSLAFKVKNKAIDFNNNLFSITSNKVQAEAYQPDDLLEVALQAAPVVPEVASDKIELYQNQPNPFTGMTTIGFYLPKSTTATLRIFDTAGRMIKVYENTLEKGYNEMIIKSEDLAQFGALYYQLATPTQIATKKMIHTQ